MSHLDIRQSTMPGWEPSILSFLEKLIKWRSPWSSLVCSSSSFSSPIFVLRYHDLIIELLMNVSGPAVTSVLKSFPSEFRSPKNVIVLHDSLSHPPLGLSPKFAGSANGHNGVRSVIASMGAMAGQFCLPRPANDEFHRIRLGIGRPAHRSADVADYVLDPLSREELDWWAYGGQGFNKVLSALESIIGRRAS